MVTIVRYGEIGTKGLFVKRKMEERLVSNIRDYLKREGIKSSVRNIHGRIMIEEDVDLSRIFGIVSFSHAIETELDLEKIKEKALEVYKGKKFRITTQRINKNFPLTSQEINMKVGEYIFNRGGEVNLENFDQEICIELIGNRAFVFGDKKKGPGGLPLGSTGKMIALLNTEEDEYAALLMMKRGVHIDYSGKEPSLLNKWNYGTKPKRIDDVDNAFENYDGLIVGLKMENAEDLKKLKELFVKYKYVYTPLFGYFMTELRKVWKE